MAHSLHGQLFQNINSFDSHSFFSLYLSLPGSQELTLYAARNEYESFQVVINGPMNKVTASVKVPWTCGTKPCVVLHRAGYLNITTVSDCRGALGLWPDPLIPDVDVHFHAQRNGLPVDVPANDNRVIWVRKS